jgi:hypothetical protein
MRSIEQEARAAQRALDIEFFNDWSPEQIYEQGYIAGASSPSARAEAIREWARFQRETVEKIGTEENDFEETDRWVDAAMKYADRIEKGIGQ